MKGEIIQTGGVYEDGHPTETYQVLVDGVTITVPYKDYSVWSTKKDLQGTHVAEVEVPDDLVEIARQFAEVQAELDARREQISALIKNALGAKK